MLTLVGEVSVLGADQVRPGSGRDVGLGPGPSLVAAARHDGGGRVTLDRHRDGARRETKRDQDHFRAPTLDTSTRRSLTPVHPERSARPSPTIAPSSTDAPGAWDSSSWSRPISWWRSSR